jgi:hypothetical protein
MAAKMSIWSNFIDATVAAMKSTFSSSSQKVNIGPAVFTAGQLEQATGTLGAFLTNFSAAVKARNYDEATELAIDEALIIAADLGVPYVGIAAKILPFLYEHGSSNLGLTPAQAALWPSTHSPDTRTNNGWPTAIQP